METKVSFENHASLQPNSQWHFNPHPRLILPSSSPWLFHPTPALPLRASYMTPSNTTTTNLYPHPAPNPSLILSSLLPLPPSLTPTLPYLFLAPRTLTHALTLTPPAHSPQTTTHQLVSPVQVPCSHSRRRTLDLIWHGAAGLRRRMGRIGEAGWDGCSGYEY